MSVRLTEHATRSGMQSLYKFNIYRLPKKHDIFVRRHCYSHLKWWYHSSHKYTYAIGKLKQQKMTRPIKDEKASFGQSLVSGGGRAVLDRRAGVAIAHNSD
jgi:hypothetical protein